MTHAAKYQLWIHDKEAFFSTDPKNKKPVELLARQKSFHFLATQKKLIEKEFKTLFPAIQKNVFEAKVIKASKIIFDYMQSVPVSTAHICTEMSLPTTTPISQASILKALNEAQTLPALVALLNRIDEKLKSENIENFLSVINHAEFRLEKIEFWEYCLYCAYLLQQFSIQYNEQDEYDKHIQQLENLLLEKENSVSSKKRTFLTQLLNDLNELANTPMHIDKLESWAAFLNVNRLAIVFNRLTIMKLLPVAQEFLLFDTLESLFGLHFDVEKMLSNLSAPQDIFNILSLVFFAIRLMTQSILLLKHTFFYQDNDTELTKAERFSLEWNKRFGPIVNDVVWLNVNLISNFGAIIDLSGPMRGWLTAAFLGFDTLFLVYRRGLIQADFLIKKQQYQEEIESLKVQRENQFITDAEFIKISSILQEQMFFLDLDWKKNDAIFTFNIAAASLFVMGFSTSMLLTAPIAPVFCYFACAIAGSMYLSGDAYGQYEEKSILAQFPSDSTFAQEELSNARYEFYKSMTKNTLVPLFTMTIFSVSWPAALCFTALCVFMDSNYPSLLAEEVKYRLSL